MRELIKGYFKSFWELITANASLTLLILVAIVVIYNLFFSDRTVRVESEALLDKQRKEIEDKRWEFEKRLSHEWAKGFRTSFFFTTALWIILSFMFFQYDLSNIFKFLQTPIKQIQEATKVADSKKVAEAETKKYSLYINTIPKNSKIRILNIYPAYKDGIQLPPGEYVIEVKAVGFQTKYECIKIKDQKDPDVKIEIELSALCCK